MLCPNCRQNVARQDNPFRPFCSERCKLIDLDNWLSERYRVPAGTTAPAGFDTADESAREDPIARLKGERD